MDIKAERPVQEVVEPLDISAEGMPGCVEETPPLAPKERETADRVLIILGLFLLVFIVTMTVIFCVKGSTPDVLIQCVLGGSGLEALVLALIKISKVRAGYKSGSDPSDGAG